MLCVQVVVTVINSARVVIFLFNIAFVGRDHK